MYPELYLLYHGCRDLNNRLKCIEISRRSGKNSVELKRKTVNTSNIILYCILYSVPISIKGYIIDTYSELD